MAEVPYDPSNPYATGTGDYGGYNDPFGGYGDEWWKNPWYVDPSNPYDNFYDPNRVGPIVPGDDGSNPNLTITGGLVGSGFPTGHGSLDPNANPTQYPGSQWPNIGIGIPGLIGVGLGGIVYGGGLDIFGGGSGGGGGGGQGDGSGPIFPPIRGSGATVGPGLGGEEQNPPTGQVWPLPGNYPASGATVGPGLGGNTPDIRPPNQIMPLPGIYPSSGPTPGPMQGGETPPPATIVPPPIPSGPTENPRPNTIYQPLGNAFPPPVGGGGGSNPPPTPTPTPTTPMDPSKRNYLGEGRLGYEAMQELMPKILGQYGQYSGQPGAADRENFYRSLGSQYGMGDWNPELTRQANLQTQESNRALRMSNLDDIETLGGRASAAQRAANPELYGMLGAYTGGAQNQLTNDYAAVGRGGQLSPDEIRMAQQSAREAAGAQGRLRGSGTQAAEVLNRFQYQQQRDQQNRANLGQSQQAAMGGMNAAQQASFNPFGTLLGQGMNTQNIGTNQTLFNQGTGFTSGALSNQYVQQLGNPYNPYAADVYGSNFNAENAMKIANSNNSAARAAAEQALLGQALGSLFQTGVATGWKF